MPYPQASVYKSGQIQWPPEPRPPLGPMPVVGAGGIVHAEAQYDSVIPFNIPNKPDVDFHRGNFCFRVPEDVQSIYGDGVPILTWDLVVYGESDQRKILDRYVRAGYTHIVLSIPQTKNHQKDLATLIDTAELCKQYGLFVIMNAYGGDGESFDDVKQWLNPLIQWKLIDIVCVCWQGDKWYSPQELCRITFELSEYVKPLGLRVGQHWINDACAWWDADDDVDPPNTHTLYGIYDRFSYQRQMTGVVDYHYYQCDVDAGVDEIQSGLRKILQSLTTQKLVAAEYDAQAQFDNPSVRTEDSGDLKGFLALCTNSYDKVKSMDGGYLNGARHPNGSAL